MRQAAKGQEVRSANTLCLSSCLSLSLDAFQQFALWPLVQSGLCPAQMQPQSRWSSHTKLLIGGCFRCAFSKEN